MMDEPATPPPIGTQGDPIKPSQKRQILIGFSTGAALGLITALLFALPNRSNLIGLAIFLSLFDCVIAPIIAVILTIIPSKRRFGLGLLLSCGLNWLVLLTICGSSTFNLGLK
ncbi:MAG TPA: hypothetical protein VNU49_00720 [Opitutaceae bacterium]|jgi:hypothetical protein|nr:hypothetical protein [Opitutaceae bacterium]